MRPLQCLLIALLSSIHCTSAEVLSSSDDAALVARADCRVQKVASGDTCTTLARKCGISDADFTKYNSNPSPCGSLKEGQQVCCSAGTKPDRRPKQNSDGSCFSYAVQDGDWCDRIAASYDLTLADLSTFNDKKTWGWQGCNPLRKTNICLSTGTPPLPAPVPNAVCGPIKPGTQKPAAGVDLATLNPCLLNACCNIWGQCGVTPEFCTAESGPTGNPGTAPANKNGCVSNCGIYIANMQKPAAQINVAYFETWNWDRSCLNMRVTDIDKSAYTHLHWSFVDINRDQFALVVNNTYGEWQNFKKMTGIKRVIALGGWGFSTGWATYDIFRKAVTGHENNLKFAMNIINFLKEHNLDGVDLDWEYPGAPDNQGEPALPPTGDPWDGAWYYILMQNLRKNMPAGKTISAAVPASHWYLKGYPIKEMATQLDYIVYMTYDLHGQWDFGNKWSQEGCPEGNCLRSHVNGTETSYALSMITKAGVPTSKIVVGVSSYGRSFGMVNKYCDAPMCRYKGKASAAAKGRCTDVAGYISNAEINEIIAKGGTDVRTRYDAASSSNILVYGDGQYVAYMNDTTKKQRQSNYKAFNFAGTADWAVDLQTYQGSKPGVFVPGSNSAQWDLSYSEIMRRYGRNGRDMNSRLRDVCVFYHGSFKEEADGYTCFYRQAGFLMIADIYIPEAFDINSGPRAAARADGQEREWFRRTSEIFAHLCVGNVRFIWDGLEAMNIGSTTSPDWHTIWDWYEWPILNAGFERGEVNLMTIDPNTWAISSYTKPRDSSTPPPGFAPPSTKPPKARKREVWPIGDPEAMKRWAPDHNLEKRADSSSCTMDSGCRACVEERKRTQPNTEIAYAYFNDKSAWNSGWCAVHVVQNRDPIYDPYKNEYIIMNVSFRDDGGFWIGGIRDAFEEGARSFVHASLPGPVSVLPYANPSYPLSFNYRGKAWNSIDNVCSSGKWEAQQNGPGTDVYSREIDCRFKC